MRGRSVASEDPPPRLFGPDFFPFLRELAKNNDRAWFQANKTRYEEHVREAALGFIRAVGPELTTLSPHLIGDPRPVGGSLMRIYRDVRFSKDKSPYRTSVGIHFMHDAQRAREESLPGFFVHLAPDASWVYAGVWRPENPRVDQIRRAIVARTAAWKKVRSAVPEIEGDSLKRPPPGFDPEHPFVEDLKRKGFIAGLPFKDTEVVRQEFPGKFLAACRVLNPLNRFLAAAMDVRY